MGYGVIQGHSHDLFVGVIHSDESPTATEAVEAWYERQKRWADRQYAQLREQAQTIDARQRAAQTEGAR